MVDDFTKIGIKIKESNRELAVVLVHAVEFLSQQDIPSIVLLGKVGVTHSTLVKQTPHQISD